MHIGKYYFPFYGGVEKVTQDIVESSAYQKKVTPFVLTHHHETSKGTVTENINNVMVKKVSIKGRLAYAPIAPSFLKELNVAIAEFSPDIIHIHMPNVSAFACLFSEKAKKIPWVIHWHSDVLGNVPDLKIKILYPFYRFFEKRLLSKAKKVIVTSPPYLKSSLALSDYFPKCQVIPLGVKDTMSNLLPKKIHSTQLNLLMIGRLTYYKGHLLLLKVMAQLGKNIKVHLNIVGEGELKPALMDYVSQHNLHERVSFLDRLSDVDLHTELNNCDLLCLPSIEKTEAFGVVLLEAAMHGKASLVTDVEGSGMSWVVQDKITGLVALNNDIQSLKKLLETAYFEPSTLSEMGVKARYRFDELFNIERVSEKYIDLYQECLIN